MAPLELALRIVGITLFVLLVVILLRARLHDLKVQSAAWLAASIGAFLLTSMHGADETFGSFIYPLTALCSTHSVWFWLFSVALFSDHARLRRGHVACLLLMALTGLIYQSALPGGEVATSVHALGLLFSAAWLAFACLAPCHGVVRHG